MMLDSDAEGPMQSMQCSGVATITKSVLVGCSRTWCQVTWTMEGTGTHNTRNLTLGIFTLNDVISLDIICHDVKHYDAI